MIRLVVLVIVAFIVVKCTMIGWRFRSGASFVPAKEKAQLAQDLERHVYRLSHEIGERSVFEYENLEKAACYITEQFKSFGYEVEFQTYSTAGRQVRNIIAVKPGTRKPEEIIIAGAHYDTVKTPGADDNASGISGILELAKSLSSEKTARTVRFIAFVNEEPPFFQNETMGSVVYAKEARAKQENIKAAVILEMIGFYSNKPFSQHYPPLVGVCFPNRGNFIALVGNFSSRQLVRDISSAFKKRTRFPLETAVLPSFVPGVTFSDHYAFWKEGYPAVMLTDTAFYRSPNYHRQSDTYETLDYLYMAEFTDGLRAALVKLAND